MHINSINNDCGHGKDVEVTSITLSAEPCDEVLSAPVTHQHELPSIFTLQAQSISDKSENCKIILHLNVTNHSTANITMELTQRLKDTDSKLESQTFTMEPHANKVISLEVQSDPSDPAKVDIFGWISTDDPFYGKGDVAFTLDITQIKDNKVQTGHVIMSGEESDLWPPRPKKPILILD
jgi:hypothetical protein